MLAHADIHVASIARSLEFYSVLGFGIALDELVEGDVIRFLSKDTFSAARLVLIKTKYPGSMIELIEFQAASRLTPEGFMPPPHHGTLAILAPALDDTMARLRVVGFMPKSEVFDVTTPALRARVVFYRDPDGHQVELMEPVRAAASPR